jgi:hypothetical protein
MIKRNGITVERNPSLKPSQQLPIHLSEYAPLSEPENAIRLLGLIRMLQEQGLDIVMLDSAALVTHETTLNDLPELNKRNGTTHKENGITAPAANPSSAPAPVIPELDELERLLKDAPDAEKREVIRTWYLALPESDIGRVRREKRRSQKEIEADRQSVKHWVDRLNKVLESLNGKVIHISKAARDYLFSNSALSKWSDRKLLSDLGTEKNKTLLDEKEIAIAMIVYRRFGGPSSNQAVYALEYYQTLKHS